MSTPEEYRIRFAVVEDAEVIATHRAEMFREMGVVHGDDVVTMQMASTPWVQRVMSTGRYVGWLVEFAGEIVAGGGVLLQDQGPVPGCLRAAGWAHIANVFTSPAHRRRGIARKLVEAILNWCRGNGVEHITLSTSEQAGSLYETLGFRYSSEFMKHSTAVIERGSDN